MPPASANVQRTGLQRRTLGLQRPRPSSADAFGGGSLHPNGPADGKRLHDSGHVGSYIMMGDLLVPARECLARGIFVARGIFDDSLLVILAGEASHRIQPEKNVIDVNMTSPLGGRPTVRAAVHRIRDGCRGRPALRPARVHALAARDSWRPGRPRAGGRSALGRRLDWAKGRLRVLTAGGAPSRRVQEWHDDRPRRDRRVLMPGPRSRFILLTRWWLDSAEGHLVTVTVPCMKA